jgi:C4-type Zn-finger protein
MNNIPQYMSVENRPVACNFCGAAVHGKITEKRTPQDKEVVKECRWVCSRCGNLTKIGVVK